MNRLKKWIGEKWQKFKHSKLFLAIIMLTIGIAYTYCYLTIKYEYRDVFNSRVVIFNNSSVAVASSASENAGANQEVEEVASIMEVRGEEQSSPSIQTIQKHFGDEWKTAYAIMMAESGGNPKAPSITDKLSDGRAYSIGLYQINLTVSEIAGINCSKAFVGKNNNARVIDEELFQKCVRLAENPDHNLESAKQKYESRGNFTAWGAYNNGAYKKFLNI